MSNPYQKMKIVKLFASNDYKTRNRAYKVIQKLLKFEFGNQKKQLNQNDIIAIWKGLYYWLWMQDKPILHEEVVEKICKLLNHIGTHDVANEFISTFFKTMIREWKKIDVHRLDKFYMLTRDFLGACFIWLRSNDQADHFIESLKTVVFNGVIDSGIEFKVHMIDILLDEMMKAKCPRSLTTPVAMACIRSIVPLSQKHVYVMKMKKRVISRLLPLHVDSKLDIDLHEIGANLLEMARKDEMFNKTRKMCYNLSKSFCGCGNKEQEDAEGSAEAADEGPAEDGASMEVDEEHQGDEEEDGDQGQEGGAASEDEEEDGGQGQEGCAASEDEEEDGGQGQEGGAASEDEEDTSDDGDDKMTEGEETNQSKPSPPANQVKPSLLANKTKKGAAAVVMKKPLTDRKVTFGKKYTQKFKKTDVNVRLSLGTVRNDLVKSILKKK